ncbi:MAG TPA: Gfo/Idh/MocA family oxidoreductase [Bryobacteraceae bacterium]|nr:Gfo/Idh/MocA family oxidoreductase [Bryobacteraceae bacterium]
MSDVSRRIFLAATALGASRVLGANDRIRLGVIGTGGRATYLMRLVKNLPNVDLVAVCDVYGPHMRKAAEIAGADCRTSGDYRELLDAKDIDGLIIGAPDHWHKKITLDAVAAGKDVYVEKPVSHSIEEGAAMVQAIESSNRVVQTGTQQRSWEHYRMGKQIVDSGMLGSVHCVFTYWYQNYGGDLAHEELNAAELDWKQWLGATPDQSLSADRFFFWRWYWDFGGGALTDLMTHWIDVIHWYMDDPTPESAASSGKRYTYNWECPDTVTCVLDYPKKFSVTYNGNMANRIDDGGIEFRGSKATLKIDREHLAVYAEASRNRPGALSPEPELTMRSLGDGTVTHLANFLDCMRTRKTPNANIRVAHEAARASHLGNLSLKMGRTVRWDASAQRAS